MRSKMPISEERFKELFDYLETMRLPEEMHNKEEDTDKKSDSVVVEYFNPMNDPSLYGAQTPFEIVDDNEETIIHRTSDGINERKLNPYEINWMEVTLYETNYVKYLLELIDSELIMDVAQAIDDEESRHIREDGQYTTISSNSYGTGQGTAHFFSYIRDNWSDDASITAVSLAEDILDLRKKSDAYQKKIDFYMCESNEKTEESYPKFTPDVELLLKEIADLKNENCHIAMERDAAEQELEEKVSGQAFNNQTGLPCFTNKQMGLFIRAVAELTEDPNPPGKTTLGEVVEKIAGYKATTVNQNLKGAASKNDIKVVADALESKLPKLAAKVRKL